ncbi:MAG TPA: acyltransferase [Candidatus Limnocylindrales bacterium]|nr:acyltransferase [Candidatus Limnocylindrales bacterium]
MRGLAIVLVLIEHTATSPAGYLLRIAPAMAGVTVFFVLSGYLITGLLARERPIGLRNFYARRAIRLGPALLVLITAVVVLSILGRNPFPWQPGVISSLFYVSNWADVAGIPTGLLGHTWSLSIEEQFYLVWPVIMLTVPRRWLLPLSVGLAVSGCLLYFLNVGPVYYSTLTNGGAILAGCAIALAERQLPRIAGLLGIALIIVAAAIVSQALAVVGAVLLLLGPVDALIPIAPVGRRAYSLYLWSWPFAYLVGGAAALPLTIIAAELSYRLVEQPVRHRFHGRFAPHRGRMTVDLPRSAGVVPPRPDLEEPAPV